MLDPWVSKIPWRRKWQPTPVFLPKEFHGQRSLAGSVVHEVAKSWTQVSEYHSLRQRKGKKIQKENGVDGSSVHGILQERILEWVAILSPGNLPNPGIEPRSSTLRADTLTSEPPGKPKNNVCVFLYLKVSHYWGCVMSVSHVCHGSAVKNLPAV